jgi:hypothetical protein
MVRKEIRKDGQKVIYEQYNDPQELLSVLNTRDANSEYANETLTKDSIDKSFAGVSSFEEAVELLQHGWKEEIETFKKEIKVHSSHIQTKYKPRIKADYVGSAPIVANAIIGLPNSMIGTNYVPKKNKVLNFLIDAGCSAYYETSRILKWGAEVVAMINRLEREGYRCKVEVMYSFAREGVSNQQQILRFKVKDASQPIDLQRFAYPIAHASMFRVIGFTWEETLPGGKRYSGKGYPLHAYDTDNRERIVEAISVKGEQTIYTNIQSSLVTTLRTKIGWKGEGGE